MLIGLSKNNTISTVIFRFEPGSIVVCVFGILQGGMGIGQSGTYIEAITTARASAVQIYRVIARKSLIDSSSKEGMKPAKFEGKIQFVSVDFNYPSRKDVTVLKNLSLEIPKVMLAADKSSLIT